MTSLSEIAKFVLEHDDYTLICHIAPDGDTLGCALALYGALLSLGKRARVVCEDAVPHTYRFLPWAEAVTRPEGLAPTASAIALDCADLERMGKVASLFKEAANRAEIDHHGTNTEYAPLNYVEETAAATEIIYELILLMGVELTLNIAVCLYTGLSSDTGHFAYANTRPHSFTTAAKLLTLGVDNNEINRRLYRSAPLGKQKLLGRALEKAEFFEGGRLGITVLMRKDFLDCGALEEDTEGIVDHIRDVEGDEIAILIRERADGTYKISMRSKTYADVSRICSRFGGGGHMRASGYDAEGDIVEIKSAAIREATAALKAK